MKRFVLLLSAVFSLFISYSQNASLNFNIGLKDKYFESEKKVLYFVQNTCKNNVKFEILNHLDSIPCRTDSIFKTNDNKHFVFNTFDPEGNLRYEGIIHLHLYDYSVLKSPSFNLMTSSVYLDSLSIDFLHGIDNTGKGIDWSCTCDWESFESKWIKTDFDTDIDETIYDSEMIKRMAW